MSTTGLTPPAAGHATGLVQGWTLARRHTVEERRGHFDLDQQASLQADQTVLGPTMGLSSPQQGNLHTQCMLKVTVPTTLRLPHEAASSLEMDDALVVQMMLSKVPKVRLGAHLCEKAASLKVQ
ncbi:hypothetical protein H920_01090 [Fukomys damarensis]|uniref:Uncharacterized protein n=1 Tax=Fukomys damarensis TaxID=885580 RepID=A0A091EP72_FUKDA|nr:hypothetical protein H920_01090 [Fukomys damarensis]